MAFSAFKNLLVKLAGSGIRFPRINADHTTDELTAAQMLAAVEALSAGRAALSADVTRVNNTLLNTNLSALDVALEASSRYRVTYRIHAANAAASAGGWDFGFNFGALSKAAMHVLGSMQVGASPTYDFDSFADLLASYATDTALGGIQNATPASGDYLAVEITLIIKTSGATTLKLLAAQNATSGGNPLTIRETTCVEWVKFP